MSCGQRRQFRIILFVISVCAGVEVTSPATSYSCLSAITAPVAVSTDGYPGEDFQVLKVLGQA